MHAPYVVNVATTNNRIRIPSRKLLQQHVDAAAEIGAKGLVVHGGHVNASDDPATGFDNWRKAIEATDLKLPLLLENTAGGDHAMARRLDRIAGTWEAIQAAEGAEQVALASQRVVPAVLEDLGHRFRHPELEPALRHLLGTAREE